MSPQATYAIANLTALTALTSSERVDGYSRLVKSDAEGNQNWFTFIAGSSAAANSDTILIPNDNPTTGRWFKHTGVLPVLVAGTVTTLSAGSAATASVSAVSGQPNTYQINLGIPQGVAGSSGGSSNWIYKNADYTAVAGDRVIADTTTPWPLKLPASPTVGQEVSIVKPDTNTLTINSQGSNIKGFDATSYNFTYTNAQEELKLIFVNSTIGWLPTPNNVNAIASNQDPYFSNVVFLCHFNGANGSNNFVDAKGSMITTVGNPTITTAQSKYGGASGAFGGSGDALTLPVNTTQFDLDDAFTIECWVYFNNTSGIQQIITSRDTNGNPQYSLSINNGNFFAEWFNSSGNGFQVSGGSVNTSTWTHVALVKSNNVLTLYVNGTSIGSTSTSGTVYLPSNRQLCVAFNRVNHNQDLNGDLDDARITNLARYAANFAPPTAQFPDS